MKRFMIMALRLGVGLNRLLLVTRNRTRLGSTPVLVSRSSTAAKQISSNSSRATDSPVMRFTIAGVTHVSSPSPDLRRAALVGHG